MPKYMLEAHGKTLFDHAISGFSKYFDSERFLFIARDVHETENFVRARAKALGIRQFDVVILGQKTAGQAETVSLGIQSINIDRDETLTIFNIDTFRPNFRYPEIFNKRDIDGYLEVFIGEGTNWSYVEPSGDSNYGVSRTAEKVRISELCCTGLYYFNSVNSYLLTFEKFRNIAYDKYGLSELYIAPMYNLLIQNGADIRYYVINNDRVIFCGVPSEYDQFLASDPY